MQSEKPPVMFEFAQRYSRIPHRASRYKILNEFEHAALAAIGEVGDGSMSSPPKIQHLPLTENEDGSMGVDLSDLENADTVSASVNCVASHCRRKNKELRVKVRWEDVKFIAPLVQMGYNIIDKSAPTYIVLTEDKSRAEEDYCQKKTIPTSANELHEVAPDATRMPRENVASSSKPCNRMCSQTPGGVTLAIVPIPSQTASANKSDELPSMRTCGPDYVDEAKGLMLHPKLEYHQDLANERNCYKWLERVTDKMKDNMKNMEPRRAAKKQTRRDGQEAAFSESLPSASPGWANFADCVEETGDEPDSEPEEIDIPTGVKVLSGGSGASVESHTETASADSHGPRTEPSRKRSAATALDEDSLFAKIRPFVNQQIEGALLPLISALRSREEDEHKHRQKMLALEREKLALMRQKLESIRRSNAVPANVAK